ncbi:MAG: amino acid dehydrogenase [Sedimenticola sp.]|nr:amino acid dehydrogenase [Sedimenticola sp.]
MKLFSHHEFDNHEQVVFCHDAASGLKAIIAIHNTNRGPALGGCRMYPYASEAEALNDVLRLSRGMTYKSALADLPLGGGKSVIIGDPRKQKTPALMRAMGTAVERLAGRYIVAEDSGTSVADMQQIGQMTRHVSGIADKYDSQGNRRSGDPSPMTAHGVFVGIRSSVRHQLGRSDLQGIRVAIQGVGNVGQHLARELHRAGAELWVSDINSEAVERMVDELGAIPVSGKEVVNLDVDVFAPCALGAVLNDETIPRLQARVVAGAANNQLEESRHGQMLAERGILYAPDYVINAGGVIDVCYEGRDIGQSEVLHKVNAIGDTLDEIFRRAQRLQRPTHEVADQLAEERFLNRQAAA